MSRARYLHDLFATQPETTGVSTGAGETLEEGVVRAEPGLQLQTRRSTTVAAIDGSRQDRVNCPAGRSASQEKAEIAEHELAAHDVNQHGYAYDAENRELDEALRAQPAIREMDDAIRAQRSPQGGGET